MEFLVPLFILPRTGSHQNDGRHLCANGSIDRHMLRRFRVSLGNEKKIEWNSMAVGKRDESIKVLVGDLKSLEARAIIPLPTMAVDRSQGPDRV